jgi:hypothetical protein
MVDTKPTDAGPDDRPAQPPATSHQPPAPRAHEPGLSQDGGSWELSPWQPWQRYVWVPLVVQPATDTPATEPQRPASDRPVVSE